MTVPLALAFATIHTRPAHHGSTGHYDRNRPVYVSGTVVDADWGYPHARLVTGALSLVLWLTALTCGRLIAYAQTRRQATSGLVATQM